MVASLFARFRLRQDIRIRTSLQAALPYPLLVQDFGNKKINLENKNGENGLTSSAGCPLYYIMISESYFLRKPAPCVPLR